MDELRGPNIQIVLHVKEGQGFSFLNSPFLVSGSLNGYILETDPVVPTHTPTFDSELVWEADKRRFRNLRIQNVPVKVEVYTTGTIGRKSRVGYILLSLLSAQPVPSNKITSIKHNWHKLLGVKTEAKCCHSQLLLSLTIQDWINTPTPRNEMPLFHNNEVATYLPTVTPAIRPSSLTLEDYIVESMKTVTSADLKPKLIPEEGLIQIGNSTNKYLFVLSFVIGVVENVDVLIPDSTAGKNDCYVTYSVFSHTIETDRFITTVDGVKKTSVQFNQRTSLRLCTDLTSLSRFFSECPNVVTRLRSGNQDIGICSTDLRKLVPTEDVKTFLSGFCNADKAITIGERCFLMSCLNQTVMEGKRKPFLDIEISLCYAGKYKERSIVKKEAKVNPLAARSASHLGCQTTEADKPEMDYNLDKRKSSSCTEVDRDVASVTYTNNSARIPRHDDDLLTNHNEIAEMIRKMYDSFTTSQEKILSARVPRATVDTDVQCSGTAAQAVQPGGTDMQEETEDNIQSLPAQECLNNKEEIKFEAKPIKMDQSSKLLSGEEKERLMKMCVEELEDWKEKQQEIFKFQLRQKEEYHLQMLSDEWNKRQTELESRLNKGIEQCRNLANDLSEATEDFRHRSYNVAQREKKLSQAKELLEQHYTGKFQELRGASQKMEDDMKHQVKLKDMRIEELEMEVQHLRKEICALKMNNMSELENIGLTKQQAAKLIQEMRALEEKLEEGEQSKAFFKEQWGCAVRELHAAKLMHRRQMLTQIQQQRHDLTDNGLDSIIGTEGPSGVQNAKGDLLEELTLQEKNTNINNVESYLDSVPRPQKQSNELLKKLMEQRDKLVGRENPSEEKFMQLNSEIRNILMNNQT